jgi:hypothetical protein
MVASSVLKQLVALQAGSASGLALPPEANAEFGLQNAEWRDRTQHSERLNRNSGPSTGEDGSAAFCMSVSIGVRLRFSQFACGFAAHCTRWLNVPLHPMGSPPFLPLDSSGSSTIIESTPEQSYVDCSFADEGSSDP